MSEFNQSIWLENSEWNNVDNPRGQMVQDLFENHLKKGQNRK